MNLWIITIILIIIISLLITIIYLQIQNSLNKDKGQESIKELDRALVKQEDTLLDLTKDIQSFHDPLNKLRRYLSGGTLAGKFGEWSLESIMQDIFNPNQYVKNAEVIKGSGKRVEFVLSLMQLIDSIENLRESVFRDSRVLIMGPNSLAAYLISVHMGFRTLALNNRAGEIMEEFGKLKKEFEKFGSSTEELLKKADAMLKAVNEHATRERQMNKAIKNMDQLDN
ncbi:MAG: DNA recombination protein RmuC [Proteobacteria bacterium]|nr:DNA recombination protein RmuC [Pseudomonadota bacterium]